jgi:hypothetical protein
MKTVRIASFVGAVFLLSMCGPQKHQKKTLSELDRQAKAVRMYAEKKGYSTHYCFLLDMRVQSGLKRFFVYDMTKHKVAFAGLVAHGSCDQLFLKEVKFSNETGGGCTSIGLYKIGSPYQGQYGRAYKLFGLQNSNSNAFDRAIVLHAYKCVPDKESFPKPICNSSGCPMVSYAFLNRLSTIIDKSDKPVLLWVYDAPIPQAQLYSFNF